MRKKTRLIILLSFTILFFIITPYIVLYSLGYRVDFKAGKIIATGGIYVRVLPSDAEIIIDSKIKNRTNFFSNSIFVQNLLPQRHEVSIKKEGYYDYQKSLLVKEKEVTKLENVILFKEKLLFNIVENDIDYFSIAPNNSLLLAKAEEGFISFTLQDLTNGQKEEFNWQNKAKQTPPDWKINWSQDSNKAMLNTGNEYFLLEPLATSNKITALLALADSKDIYFNPQDPDQIFFLKMGDIYSNLQETAIIKNVVSYQIENQNFVWLGGDGYLYNSDALGQTKTKISKGAFLIKKNTSYKIIIFSGNVFLKENNSLFLFDQNQKIFENFYQSIKDLKFSQSKNQIIYFNDNEIFYYLLDLKNHIFLNNFKEKIDDVNWLNDDYIYFQSGNKIIISETDIRGNINMVTLPQTIALFDGKDIEIKNPKITFSQADKKFYILTQKNILVSERIIP